MKLIDTIVNACITRGYITQDKAPWLHYALGKRITSVLGFVPLCAIGLLLVRPTTLLSFYISFYLLRSLTNGWHAKSVGICLLCSIIGEVIFLGVLSIFWNQVIGIISLGVSTIILWFFAPYNHPNMNLTENELVESKKQIRIRLVMLFIVVLGLKCAQAVHWSVGIELGVTMTSSTLLLAYIPGYTKQEK